jgi:type II secretory pathway component GspD/PulD (secretin)
MSQPKLLSTIKLNLICFAFAIALLGCFDAASASAFAQEKTTGASKPPRRTSGVKLKETNSAEDKTLAQTSDSDTVAATPPSAEVAPSPQTSESDDVTEGETGKSESDAKKAKEAKEAAAKAAKAAEEERERDRIAAGLAALERETKRAADEAAARERLAAAEREAALKKEMQAEITAREEALAKERDSAAAKLAEVERLSGEKITQLERETTEKTAKIAEEATQKQREADELRRAANELSAQVEASEKAKQESEARAAAAEQAAQVARLDAEKQKSEIERRAAEEKTALEKRAGEERERVRAALILQTAKNLQFLKPETALGLVPATLATAEEIEAKLKEEIKKQPSLVKALGFCASAYEGEPLTFDLPGEVNLETLLNELRYRYNINFLPDAEIMDLPIRVSVQNLPWTTVLRSKLRSHDLVPVCSADGRTIEIYKRAKYLAYQEAERKSEPLITDVIELNFLQAQTGGQVSVAGKALTSGGGSIEGVVADIDKILKENGSSGSVSRITGTSKLLISATQAQFERIRTIIKEADQEPDQVEIRGFVFATNDTNISDFGLQGSAIVGTGDLRQLGGFTTLPGGGENGGGNGGGASNQSGQIVPGGVRELGPGFGQPTNGLSAASPNQVFGVSSVIGTAQFSVQLTSLRQRGKAIVKSTPFGIVLNGQTINLDVGRQVPVLIQSLNGLGSPGTLEILNAGNILFATPQIYKENGTPAGVILNLRLESNDVDTSVTTQGVPSVNRRSIQNNFLLKADQTVVLGGFTVDEISNTESKSLFGLFRRKAKTKSELRLYFAVQIKIIPKGGKQPSLALPDKLNTEIPNDVPSVKEPKN